MFDRRQSAQGACATDLVAVLRKNRARLGRCRSPAISPRPLRPVLMSLPNW